MAGERPPNQASKPGRSQSDGTTETLLPAFWPARALTSPENQRGVRWVRKSSSEIGGSDGLEIRSSHAAGQWCGNRSRSGRGFRSRMGRDGRRRDQRTGAKRRLAQHPEEGRLARLRRRRRGVRLRSDHRSLRRGRRHVRPHRVRPVHHRVGQRRLGSLPGPVGRSQLVVHGLDHHPATQRALPRRHRRATEPRSSRTSRPRPSPSSPGS